MFGERLINGNIRKGNVYSSYLERGEKKINNYQKYKSINFLLDNLLNSKLIMINIKFINNNDPL